MVKETSINSLSKYLVASVVMLVFAAFFVESVLFKTQGAATSAMSIGALLALPLISVPAFMKWITWKRLFAVAWPLLLLALWYVADGGLFAPGGQASEVWRTIAYIVFVIIALAAGIALSQMRIAEHLLWASLAAMVFASTVWVYRFNEESIYGFATTKNVVVGLIAHTIFFMYLRMKRDVSFVVPLALIALISIVTSQRFFIPAALAALVVYLAVRRIGLGFSVRQALFWGLCAFGVGFFIFVSQLDQSAALNDLNRLSVEWTGRRLNSGREELWRTIWIYLSSSPWTGLGASVQPSDLFDTQLSSHNSFLQVTLQVGFIGLAVLATQIYVLFSAYGKLAHKEHQAKAAAYLTFVVFHAFTETFLTTNSFILAAATWVNIGVALQVRGQVTGAQDAGHQKPQTHLASAPSG